MRPPAEKRVVEERLAEAGGDRAETQQAGRGGAGGGALIPPTILTARPDPRPRGQ